MADARIEIVLAARDASQAAFAQVKNAIRELSASVFSLKGVLAGLGAGIGFGALAKSVVDTASSFEQLEVKLDTLTRGRGKETLEAINAWAKDMPINTREAVDVFAMMQAYGLNPTIEKMQTLVDVSSIFGEDAAPRVARALGQIQARGKLSAEELMQLSEVGINAGKYLEQAFGASVEEIQKQSLRIEDVVEAIWRGLDADYSGAAQKAMDSWRGLVMQFESNWMEIERRVAQAGLFDALKEGLAAVNREMSAWIEKNEVFFKQDLPKHIKEMAQSAKNLVETLMSVPREVWGALIGFKYGGIKGAFFGAGAGFGTRLYGLAIDEGEALRASAATLTQQLKMLRDMGAESSVEYQRTYEKLSAVRKEIEAKGYERIKLLPEPTVEKTKEKIESPIKSLVIQSKEELAERKKLHAEVEREMEEFARAKLLPTRLEEALATGVGPNQIAQMEAERLKRIREEAKKVYGEAQDDWIGRHREEIGPYDDETVKRNLEDIKRQGEEASNYWVELSQRTAERMQDNFSDLFFDVFAGELKSAEDYFAAFARSLQRMAADIAGQLVTQGLFGASSVGKTAGGGGGLGGLFGWLSGLFGASVQHAGGEAGAGPRRQVPAFFFAAAPRLHAGLAPDEFPAILQRGERVIPRRQAVRERPQVVINVQAPGGRVGRESLQGLQTALYAALDRAGRRNL